MDIYKTLFDQEEVLKDYIESRKFNASIKSWVECCKSCNISYEETITKTKKKFKISKYWAEEKVEEFWNDSQN